MSSFIIVAKENNQIHSVLELDGDYYLNTPARFSVKVILPGVLDFGAYTYFFDQETNSVSKVAIVDPVDDSGDTLTTTELRFE